jgi:hypothetical protein
MRDYFVPKTRAGLILALSQVYPQPSGIFKHMKKAQLRAIFFKTREKQLNGTFHWQNELINNLTFSKPSVE